MSDDNRRKLLYLQGITALVILVLTAVMFFGEAHTALLAVCAVCALINIIFVTIKVRLPQTIALHAHVQPKHYNKTIPPEMDRLTNAYSKRYGLSYLETVMQKERAEGCRVVVMAIDVDNMKRINGDFGYEIGDEVLKMMTSSIISAMRDSDRLFRWGGDDFLLVYGEVDVTQHGLLAQKLMRSVEKLEFQSREGCFKVTLSVGGAVFLPQDADVAEVVERAQTAMRYSHNRKSTHYTWYEDVEINGGVPSSTN